MSANRFFCQNIIRDIQFEIIKDLENQQIYTFPKLQKINKKNQWIFDTLSY